MKIESPRRGRGFKCNWGVGEFAQEHAYVEEMKMQLCLLEEIFKEEQSVAFAKINRECADYKGGDEDAALLIGRNLLRGAVGRVCLDQPGTYRL